MLQHQFVERLRGLHVAHVSCAGDGSRCDLRQSPSSAARCLKIGQIELPTITKVGVAMLASPARRAARSACPGRVAPDANPNIARSSFRSAAAIAGLAFAGSNKSAHATVSSPRGDRRRFAASPLRASAATNPRSRCVRRAPDRPKSGTAPPRGAALATRSATRPPNESPTRCAGSAPRKPINASRSSACE